jgi:hypothetical protein
MEVTENTSLLGQLELLEDKFKECDRAVKAQRELLTTVIKDILPKCKARITDLESRLSQVLEGLRPVPVESAPRPLLRVVHQSAPKPATMRAKRSYEMWKAVTDLISCEGKSCYAISQETGIAQSTVRMYANLKPAEIQELKNEFNNRGLRRSEGSR